MSRNLFAHHGSQHLAKPSNVCDNKGMDFLRNIVALTLLLALSGCPPQPSPVPPSTKEDCVQACTNLDAMGCELAESTPGGKTCLEWCDYYRTTPAGIDPICLKRSRSCEDADLCSR